MRRHWGAGPHRTYFASRLIANCENEIHCGRAGLSEFVPALAAESGRGHPVFVEQLHHHWMHFTSRMTAGAESAKSSLAAMIHHGFGDYAPGAITGAYEEDVVDSLGHRDARGYAFASLQQVGAQQAAGSAMVGAVTVCGAGSRPYSVISPKVRNVSHEMPLGSEIHPLSPRA
jgi:hypothetical protein